MRSHSSIVAATALAILLAGRALAVVFYATNGVAYHTSAPTGAWAGSGWAQTVPLGGFLGTVIGSNAVLTAKHLGYSVGQTFVYGGQACTVTVVTADAASDLSVLRFRPPATNWARINIEPAVDTGRWIVVQGRGRERGSPPITTATLTNGWPLGANNKTRRWGINRYDGFAGYSTNTPSDDVLAWATFDAGGHADECMLSFGDSGGPSFAATGSGWKLIGVSFAVDPALFSRSHLGTGAFYATLYDYSGLYYNAGTNWFYATPTNQPLPCAFFSSRVSKRVAWLTNVVQGLTFPADVGLAWQGGGALGGRAAEGVAFTLLVTNRGPYTARSLGVDVTWGTGLHVRSVMPSTGSYTPATGRWTLPVLADGEGAALVATAVVWRATAVAGTNCAAVAVSDKPDDVASNNTACVGFNAPPTATVLQLR